VPSSVGPGEGIVGALVAEEVGGMLGSTVAGVVEGVRDGVAVRVDVLVAVREGVGVTVGLAVKVEVGVSDRVEVGTSVAEGPEGAAVVRVGVVVLVVVDVAVACSEGTVSAVDWSGIGVAAGTAHSAAIVCATAVRACSGRRVPDQVPMSWVAKAF
jgi:hypothetical protein